MGGGVEGHAIGADAKSGHKGQGNRDPLGEPSVAGQSRYQARPAHTYRIGPSGPVRGIGCLQERMPSPPSSP